MRSLFRKMNGKHGKLIVFEGLDGSGKATQSARYVEHLKQLGRSPILLSFPNYESESSALVRMYLSGTFGSDPSSVNPFAASAFFAVDRIAGFLSDWQPAWKQADSVLIADRYTTSNAVHQCCKLPREEWNSFLSWLYDFEYGKLGLPAPDAVIYLRLPPETSEDLLVNRYHGDQTRLDIHERDLEYLRHARKAADYCAGYSHWHTVECAPEGKLRSIDDIAAEVVNVLDSIIFKK